MIRVLRGGLIRAVSTLWSFASGGMRALIQLELYRPESLPVRTIAVGNLQAGGAGKTPLVAFLARQALARGLRVVILSRGYRGKWERGGGAIPPGALSTDPQLCGDEPALLQSLVPQATIGVGADRVEAYLTAWAEAQKAGIQDFDLAILDDGFQHFRVARDLDILALTSHSPSDAVFRDFPATAESADLVVWTKGLVRPDPYGRPMVRVSYSFPPPEKDVRYWFVAGLANGAEAKAMLVQAGYLIVRDTLSRDHVEYTRPQLDILIQEASRLGYRLLVPGKDAVKWKHLEVPADRFQVVEPELQLTEGQDLWEQWVWGANARSDSEPRQME